MPNRGVSFQFEMLFMLAAAKKTMKKLITRQQFRFGLPVALLLLCTFFVWLTDGDRRLAGAVYGHEGVWPGIGRFPWNLLYEYAGVPAFLLAGLAAGTLMGGLFVTKVAARRREALFFLLLLALGPGLVVNVLLKDNLGRARPREIREFGGQYPFTQIWQRGETGRNSSFPSGHASVAFYLLSPWFILRRHNRVQASGWLAGGLGYGFLVGTARILQGSHFLLDVLWAGGLVYLCGEALSQMMSLDASSRQRNAGRWPLSCRSPACCTVPWRTDREGISLSDQNILRIIIGAGHHQSSDRRTPCVHETTTGVQR